MTTRAQAENRRKAFVEVFRIFLASYPEHVIAQAARKAWEILSAEPHAIHRAILVGEWHAKARMAAVRRAGAAKAEAVATEVSTNSEHEPAAERLPHSR